MTTLTLPEIEFIADILLEVENSAKETNGMTELLTTLYEETKAEYAKIKEIFTEAQIAIMESKISQIEKALREKQELPDKIFRLRVKLMDMKDELLLGNATAKL